MSSMIKLLTIVMLLVASSQIANAGEFENSKNSFSQLQKELWIQGIPGAELEDDQVIEKKINDISNLSATDFYPEELTQALNRI